MENYKTIKELADELHTNKTRIFRIIKSKRIETIQKQNRFYLDEHSQKLIKEEISEESNQSKRIENETNETIDILKKELEMSHQSNEELRKLLDQQQQLTLQSNKQIEQLQNQLMLLAPQKEESEREKAVSENHSQNVGEKEDLQVDSVEEDEEEKKWWQFWK